MTRARANVSLRRNRGAAKAILAAGTVYFLLVFGCGFILGVVRTLWLVPRVGERWAELTETPVMLVVIYVTARWISRRFALRSRGRRVRVCVGILALALLVGAELGFVLHLRRISLADYLARRDPVSGAVYALSLLLFAAMPALVGRGHSAERGSGPMSNR